MKKFLVRILIFFMAVAIIDIFFGKCSDYMYEHSKSGDSRKINFAIRDCNAEVLIMGSSRANHHYNPHILADSLDMSVYNLGIDGSGAILMDGFYRLITQRYIPKLIIYELTPYFDCYKYTGDANNTRYLSQLKPYYREKCLKQVFNDIDVREIFKLNSGLYRHNTSWLNLFRSYICSGEVFCDGYAPLQGVMNESEPFEVSIGEIDSLKIKYFKQFIEDCDVNGTKLLFIISPRYGATSSAEYQPCFDVCSIKGCEVWDYYCDEDFVTVKQYFTDPFHMNSRGADEFTSTVAHRINAYLH